MNFSIFQDLEQGYNNALQDKPCNHCRLIEIGEAACYLGKCGVCGRPARRWKIYTCPKTDVVVVAKKIWHLVFLILISSKEIKNVNVNIFILSRSFLYSIIYITYILLFILNEWIKCISFTIYIYLCIQTIELFR